MGFPTTSQYSSKASPVSLVSDMGDLTNPARGRGSRNAVTERQKTKDLLKNKAMRCRKQREKTLASTITQLL